MGWPGCRQWWRGFGDPPGSPPGRLCRNDNPDGVELVVSARNKRGYSESMDGMSSVQLELSNELTISCTRNTNVVVVVIGKEMQFGHEQRDVYRISIRYVPWAYQVAKSLKGSDRPARDQLLRASQSIPLNVAEGNGQGTTADRRRFLAIARASALACASLQDCLEACEALAAAQNAQGRQC